MRIRVRITNDDFQKRSKVLNNRKILLRNEETSETTEHLNNDERKKRGAFYLESEVDS